MDHENQNIEHKRIWKDEYLKWVSGFANLKHPTFRKEHGGVTAIIPREIFMSIRGGQHPMGADGAKNGAIDAKNELNDTNLTERQKQVSKDILLMFSKPLQPSGIR